MSGLVKKVGKVFKKVGKFVKKRWKLIVVAAAIYFTAGVALSYFGSTAGFASAMPGFGAGGIFSKAAVYMGFQGSATVASGLSLTSGAFTAGVPSAGIGAMSKAGLKALYGKTAAEAAGVLAPVTPTASAIVPGVTKAQTVAGAMGGAGNVAAPVSQTVTPLVTGGGGKTYADVMAGAMKMQAASTLLKTAAGFFEPSEEELMEKKHELQWGNAFGVGRDGSTTHGWASTGGSTAFAGAGMPQSATYGEQDNAGGTTKSNFARNFLDSPYGSAPSNSNPYTMNQQQADFIQPPGAG